ncbi:hypothetical protein ACFL5O_08680 [Myxococcota bacterium]
MGKKLVRWERREIVHQLRFSDPRGCPRDGTGHGASLLSTAATAADHELQSRHLLRPRLPGGGDDLHGVRDIVDADARDQRLDRFRGHDLPD